MNKCEKMYVAALFCVFIPSLALMMISGWKTLQEEESGVMVKVSVRKLHRSDTVNVTKTTFDFSLDLKDTELTGHWRLRGNDCWTCREETKKKPNKQIRREM